MSIYAEVIINKESSKTAGIDYIQSDIFQFMHRIASGDYKTDYPGMSKGTICNDIYEIQGLDISPEGEPTNWDHYSTVEDAYQYSILKGYRKDDVGRSGFPTVGFINEQVLADYTTEVAYMHLGGADDFNGGVFTNKSEYRIRNPSSSSGAQYEASKILGLETMVFHVWADDSMVMVWSSDQTTVNQVYGTQLFLIGEKLHDFQNSDDYSLGFCGNFEGSNYPALGGWDCTYYASACNVENGNIFTGERFVKASNSSAFCMGYGNAGLNSFNSDAENYFPIEDGDGNFISQLPVLTTGTQDLKGYWHWAKWPQNNIIYHPGQSKNNIVGQLVNIGGKRFICHGISHSGASGFRSDGEQHYSSACWLYLPLDN